MQFDSLDFIATGRLVFQQHRAGPNATFSVGQLPGGVYAWRWEGVGGMVVLRR